MQKIRAFFLAFAATAGVIAFAAAFVLCDVRTRRVAFEDDTPPYMTATHDTAAITEYLPAPAQLLVWVWQAEHAAAQFFIGK